MKPALIILLAVSLGLAAGEPDFSKRGWLEKDQSPAEVAKTLGGAPVTSEIGRDGDLVQVFEASGRTLTVEYDEGLTGQELRRWVFEEVGPTEPSLARQPREPAPEVVIEDDRSRTRNLEPERQPTPTRPIIESTSSGRWTAESKRDPMDDTTTVLLQLPSTNTAANTLGRAEKAYLVLRCEDRSLQAFISTPFVLDSDYRTDRTPLRLRYDDDPTSEVRATISTSHTAVFVSDPLQFADSLLRARKVLAEVRPYDRTSVVLEFDPVGLDRHVEELLTACSSR